MPSSTTLQECHRGGRYLEGHDGDGYQRSWCGRWSSLVSEDVRGLSLALVNHDFNYQATSSVQSHRWRQGDEQISLKMIVG